MRTTSVKSAVVGHGGGAWPPTGKHRAREGSEGGGSGRGVTKEDCEFGCTLRNLTTFLPNLLFKDFAAEHSEAKSRINPFDWKWLWGSGCFIRSYEDRAYGNSVSL